MTTRQLREIHAYADLLPVLSAEEYASLRTSIQQEGILQPIVVSSYWGGAIIDGRHRYQVAIECDIPDEQIPLRWWEPRSDDPEQALAELRAFIDHLNFEHRSRPNPSQRAAIVAKMIAATPREIEKLAARHPRRTEPGGILPGKYATGAAQQETIRREAEAAKISPSTLKQAQQILRDAPDLLERVAGGEITVYAASQELRRRKAEADAATRVHEPNPQKPSPPDRPAVTEDQEGVPVPERLIHTFTAGRRGLMDLAGELQKLHTRLAALLAASFAEGSGEPVPGAEGSYLTQSVLVDVKRAKETILQALPHAVCPRCSGNPPEREDRMCQACKGRGFLHRDLFLRVIDTIDEERRAAS